MLKKNRVCISIFESLYIIYFLNYFKTTIALDYGLIINNLFNGKIDFINHPIIKSEIPISYVCPLGNWAGWFFGIFFILRNYFPILQKINIYLIILLFIGSFMNINVLCYLIPIFIIEIYLYLN